jgi:protein-tyrosine phosphatase
MKKGTYSREIDFEAISGFRDLGGYQAVGGHRVAWSRLFRSGELRRMTGGDLIRLKKEIGLKSVIDLRHARKGLEQQQEISLLNEVGAKYFYVPLNTNSDRMQESELYGHFSTMGEVYLYRIDDKEYGRRLIEALEIMAEPGNYPLVFHCLAGKDRSGVLAAMVLGGLGVGDEDIIHDYTLSARYMNEMLDRLNSDPATPEYMKTLPGYTWEAAPESMALFLSALQQEYGSIRGYLKERGAETSLFDRLEQSLLV